MCSKNHLTPKQLHTMTHFVTSWYSPRGQDHDGAKNSRLLGYLRSTTNTRRQCSFGCWIEEDSCGQWVPRFRHFPRSIYCRIEYTPTARDISSDASIRQGGMVRVVYVTHFRNNDCYTRIILFLRHPRTVCIVFNVRAYVGHMDSIASRKWT